jgi:vacuolar-type H+-ATPase subunit I/STV1
MRNKSFNDRLIHASYELSIYWIIVFMLFVFLVGPETMEVLPMTVSAGVAFLIISAKFILDGLREARLMPDWGLVFPELGGSCYTKSRLIYRAARFLGNFSVALGIGSVLLLLEKNTYGAPLIILACSMYSLYAMFEAVLSPRTDYNWELIYPELALCDFPEDEELSNDTKTKDL